MGIILERNCPQMGGNMIQVKLNKNCKYGSRNTVLLVSRNMAHGIVDGGFGTIYKPKKTIYKNRMLRGGK